MPYEFDKDGGETLSVHLWVIDPLSHSESMGTHRRTFGAPRGYETSAARRWAQ
jgi:hypothetical protein